MTDNSAMKNNMRQFDFGNQTPLRTSHINNGEFYTSQKDKYNTTNRQLSHSLANITNVANVVMNSEAYHNQKDVYENQIGVLIKSTDRQDYQNNLTIKLSMLNPSPSHTQILHIELTDESNHLFLYTLDISETDFLHLKNEQSILVDFQAFPSKLIEMFDLCLASANSSEKIKFLCILNVKNTGEAAFNIVETNQFKALTHLSLKFREANDQTLKQYLALRLSDEKSTNEKLRIRIDGLEDTLSMKSNELEKSTVDLMRFQNDRDKTIEKLLLDEQRKLSELKQTSFERETTLQKEFDREKKEWTQQYENNIRELQARIDRISKENSDLTSIKTELEIKKRELTGKVEAFEKENVALHSEISSRRAETKELSTVTFDKEKRVAQLEAKIADLENQIRNKDEINRKNEELIQTSNSQKANLEETIAGLKKQVEKLEKKVFDANEEINKGSEYIEQLEHNIATQKEKLNTKNAVIKGQEQTISQNQDKLDALTRNVNELQRDLDVKQLRVKELENIVEDQKGKLLESQKAIENNQSMIQWLNKSLNETQKPAGPRVPFSTSRYTPATTSPYKQYPDDGRDSVRYSTTLNMDKYNKYQTDDYSGYTPGAANTFGAKTVASPGDNFLNMLGTKSIDLGRGDQSDHLNKENYDFGNKSVDYRNRSVTKNMYSTSPVNDFGATGTSADFGGYNGTRTIQPIRYQDPKR